MTTSFKVAWVGATAFMVFVLVAGLSGCSGKNVGAQKQQGKEAPSAAQPQAKDDYATTVEKRKVKIEMVANDSGKSLEIDKLGQGHGEIICEAEVESGKVRSCDYTPAGGFSGKDEFSYGVKDASGKTDSAMVHVRVKPAN